MTNSPFELEEQGKRAYGEGQYAEAARLFAQAADEYTRGGDALRAAESKNNQSVALLQNDQSQQAFEAANGTDKIFEAAGDVKRQAIALSNQAAALDALKRPNEALPLYERAATLFADINEGDMRSMVLKSIAAIRLKQGKLNDTAMDMLGSLNATQKPNLFQRILRFFLRLR